MLTSFNFKIWFKQNYKILGFLIILVFVAYGNSLNNDFVSDDIPAILKKDSLGEISYVFKQPFAFLRPFFYFIINKIFGRSPFFYRSINILFHIGSVSMLYFLLKILAGSKIAFFTSTIFAIHPIQSESVSWISGGPYSQYSFFLLTSFFLYILSQDIKLYLISILVFMLSLFSCQNAAVFPLFILIFIIILGNMHREWKNLIPFFILSFIWGLFFLGKVGPRINDIQSVHYQQPIVLNPIVQIPIAITSYLELIFWPKALTLYHSEMVFTQAEYIIRLIIFIIFLGIIIWGYFRNRQLFFWLSFFIISLLPTFTPFGISWIVAERYVYLGSIGIFVVVALFFKRLSEVKNLKVITYIIFSLMLIALCARTITRNIDWRNEDSLWIATARISPSSPNTHNNLGDVYYRRGDLESAVNEFKKAIEINPKYADAYHNLANTYQQMGMVEDAIGNYKRAVSLNPKLWQSHQNLAAIYFAQKEFKLSRYNLENAIEINPLNSYLYHNLGMVYIRLGKNSQAKNAFEKALQLDANNQMAKQALSSLERNKE